MLGVRSTTAGAWALGTGLMWSSTELRESWFNAFYVKDVVSEPNYCSDPRCGSCLPGIRTWYYCPEHGGPQKAESQNRTSRSSKEQRPGGGRGDGE